MGYANGWAAKMYKDAGGKLEERKKELNIFSRLYAFVKKLFRADRKPKDLKSIGFK